VMSTSGGPVFGVEGLDLLGAVVRMMSLGE